LKRRYRQSICRPKTREGSRSRQDSAACVSLSSDFNFQRAKPTTEARANLVRLAFETTGLPPGSPGREPRFREEQCPSRAGEAPWRPDKDRINTNPGPVSTTDFRFSFEFRRLPSNPLNLHAKHSYPHGLSKAESNSFSAGGSIKTRKTGALPASVPALVLPKTPRERIWFHSGALEVEAVPRIADAADNATKQPDKSVDLIDRRRANNGQSAHVHAAPKREPGVGGSRFALEGADRDRRFGD